MTRLFWTTALPLIGLGALAACDKGGYADIGEPIDITEQCELLNGSSTWVRAESDPSAAETKNTVWTHYVIVGAEEPAALVDGEGCLNQGSLNLDGEIDLRQGRYRFAAGVGSAHTYAQYTFVHQPDISVLQRTGARREDFESPATVPLAFAVNAGDPNKLDITIDGVTHTYDNLIRLMGSIDYTTQYGAEKAAMLFNLPLFTSQGRIIAFGSGGMTQYMSGTAVFAGMLEREVPPFDFTVHVEGLLMPYTVIDYRNFEDFTGIVLHGPQNTLVNASGTGDMSGVLTFSFRTDVDDPSQTVEGTFDYAGGVGVQVVNGFGDGGEGVMVIGGNNFTVATDVLIHPDFTAELPLP